MSYHVISHHSTTIHFSGITTNMVYKTRTQAPINGLRSSVGYTAGEDALNRGFNSQPEVLEANAISLISIS